MDGTESALLVIGRDTDGSWTVCDSAGAMPGQQAPVDGDGFTV